MRGIVGFSAENQAKEAKNEVKLKSVQIIETQILATVFNGCSL